jgi:protein involved in polysaccharide export with SLBB domain
MILKTAIVGARFIGRLLNPNNPLSRHSGAGRNPAIKNIPRSGQNEQPAASFEERPNQGVVPFDRRSACPESVEGREFVNQLDSGLRRNDVIFSGSFGLKSKLLSPDESGSHKKTHLKDEWQREHNDRITRVLSPYCKHSTEVSRMIRQSITLMAAGKPLLSRPLPVNGKKSSLMLMMAFLLAAFTSNALADTTSPFSMDQSLNFQSSAPPAPSVPAPPPPSVPVVQPTPQPAQYVDYSANQKSNVFGANLFTGAFARQGATQFNPDYIVAPGDNIQVRLWGAFQYDATLTVDPKGNIFLPNIGPVQVLGARNRDIQRTVESAVSKAFRANVYSYANLAAAQPVRVFVGGFANRPGLYSGTSMDSLLNYLDQAGGIDAERGSFLNVQVKRGNQTRATFNLYDFMLEGRMPLIQLADGDVIFVSPRQNTLTVSGWAENAKRFEFNDNTRTVADLIKVAKPRAQATHVRVVRNTGTVKNTEYYPLSEAGHVALQNGDELEFTADKKNGTITVRVEGEHDSAQEYVLPDGIKLGEVLKRIQFSSRSDTANLQLFRTSVKERQKQMLQTSLRSLEVTALTARSGTGEEARLRKDEADLILQWVERAKKIEPSGQVLIAQSAEHDNLLLENGDVLRIPVKDGLVLISGEVLFPNTIAFDPALGLNDYIRLAGGYTQTADVTRIIVAHRDGSFNDASAGGGFFGINERAAINPGDEILVLPKVDFKSRQFWKEMSQIIYQIAVSARIVTKF